MFAAVMAKLAAVLAGPFGWIARLFLNYVWKKLSGAISKMISDWKRAREQKKTVEKVEQHTPQTPQPEKVKDEEGYLNS